MESVIQSCDNIMSTRSLATRKNNTDNLLLIRGSAATLSKRNLFHSICLWKELLDSFIG